MSKEEMICDITGEYCKNAGSDYCIDRVMGIVKKGGEKK